MLRSTGHGKEAFAKRKGKKRSHNTKEGQASVEYMMLFIVFMVAVVVAMMVSVHRSHTISQAQVDLEANRVLGTMSERINTVYLQGDGFSMNVTIPERIYRMDYFVTINSNEVIIKLESATYVKNTLTDNITGSFTKGTSSLTNRDGEIVIKAV